MLMGRTMLLLRLNTVAASRDAYCAAAKLLIGELNHVVAVGLACGLQMLGLQVAAQWLPTTWSWATRELHMELLLAGCVMDYFNALECSMVGLDDADEPHHAVVAAERCCCFTGCLLRCCKAAD
ncbi:hypothetical protein Dimus_026421, partial [Dionaea muscipula]